MARTQLGLHGPQAAYGGFSAKATFVPSGQVPAASRNRYRHRIDTVHRIWWIALTAGLLVGWL